MTYRHHSLRCHHRVQNTQGSNQHHFRITCQECQGHLAIVHGRQLNVESRRLIEEYLDALPVPVLEAPPGRRPPPQPRARAAAAASQPQDEPEPAERQEDAEVHRARVLLKIVELNQEIQRLTAELEALPRPATQPPQARNPPEAEPEEMPRAQERPHQ